MIDKIFKKLKSIKVQHMVLLYFLIQPFLAMYMTFDKNPFQIFGMSINVLLNFFFVFLMVVYAFILLLRKDRGKLKKNIIIAFIYGGIFLIYCILHYKNMQLFDDKIFDRNSYDFIREVYFIFRSYVLPVVLLYTLYTLNLDKKKILFAIRMSVFVICFVIIITNIFGVSLAAYAEHGKLIYIDGSIFHWLFFNGNDNFELYTSKGWFESANELSAILLMFSPIIIRDAYKADNRRNRILSSILLVMLIITMNMLGTRTAVIGIFAALICVIVIFVFFRIIKRIDFDIKNFVVKNLLLLVFCVFIFMNSPYYNKNYGKFKTEFEDRPIEEEIEDIEEDDVDSFADFLEKYSWNYYIEPQILEIYPVNGDTAFWRFIINRDLRLNSNYRIIKTDLYNRILERNDNKGDFWFGIGYNDVLNSEKDYYMQMYYFGLVGVIILIGPYIFNILYGIYRILRYRESLFVLDNIIALMCVCIGVVIPYLSGHVFGVVFPMNYLVLCSVLLLNLVGGSVKNES